MAVKTVEHVPQRCAFFDSEQNPPWRSALLMVCVRHRPSSHGGGAARFRARLFSDKPNMQGRSSLWIYNIYIYTYRYILWLYIHICWDSMIGMIHIWSDPLLFLVARCSTTLENMFLFFAVMTNHINMNEKRDEDLEQQNSWAHSQAELYKNGPRICALWDSKAWRWAT